MASPELEVVIGMLRSASPLAGGTLLEKRGRMELQTTLAPPPADVRYEPIDAGGVPAEWTAAPGARSDRALVYLHGGGYCLGSIATHRALVARIARETWRARALGRLPARARASASRRGRGRRRRVPLRARPGARARAVAFAGDSAGGGLAVAALVAARDAGLPLPAAGACISPWLDLTLSGGSMQSKAPEDPMLTPEDLRLFADAYAGRDLRAPARLAALRGSRGPAAAPVAGRQRRGAARRLDALRRRSARGRRRSLAARLGRHDPRLARLRGPAARGRAGGAPARGVPRQAVSARARPIDAAPQTWFIS